MAEQGIIGLIGGLSWESSAEYYRIVNQAVRGRLGGMRSARVLMWSFDFGEIEAMQAAGEWEAAAAAMAEAARRLAAGGAGLLVICSNTMHRVAGAVEAAGVPLLHIAEPTGVRVRAAGLRTVGLLGTAFTMEEPFYRERLEARHGLTVLVPEAADRALVHRVIYEELVQGRVEAASRVAFQGVIERLVARGAEGVILGCTEIMLLVGAQDSAVPLFDTTTLHALAAVDWALAGC